MWFSKCNNNYDATFNLTRFGTGTFAGSGLIWNYDVNYASCVDGSQEVICPPNASQSSPVAKRGSTVYDYGFRIYNPRIAKFLSVDPLTRSYPMLTPYQFASNRPIDGIDLDGLEWRPVNSNGDNVEIDDSGSPLDPNQQIASYQWEGYNYNGNGIWTRPLGTVAQGAIWTDDNTMRFFGSSGVPNSVEIGGTVTDVTLDDQPSIDRIDNLHPVIRQRVKEFVIRSEYELDMPIRIVQGLRTYAEQNSLYAQGRTQTQLNAVGLNNVVAQPNMPVVTNARGGYSNHNFGLAIDAAFLDQNGNVNWDVANYNRLGPLGERLGFNWGGRWTGLVDRPHFEMMFDNTLTQLRQAMNNGNTITDGGNTYPNVNTPVQNNDQIQGR